MLKKRIRLAFSAGLALLAAGAAAVEPAMPSAACPSSTSSGYEVSNCWTTPYGPAAADVVLVEAPNTSPTKSPNMLQCESGPYALCFYSGPPEATGKNCPSSSTCKNNKLPCKVNGVTATCDCQYYSSGLNFVDINGILNLAVYQETVAACGATGERCRNLANEVVCKERSLLSICKEAPVCQYIREQNAKKPESSLVPNADTISDFSFAMAPNYHSTKTTQCPKGLYAGCMTAACTFPNGVAPADGGIVSCNCPLVTGEFQIGQVRDEQGDGYPCDLGPGYVWSASRTVVIDSASNAAASSN